MEILIQQCVNALSLGGTYALLALGLAVVFSVLGMINFAHGEILTIAGYTVFFAIVGNVPPILIIPLALIVAMATAALMERIAFRPLRGANGTTLLITSFAVSGILQMLFQNLLELLYMQDHQGMYNKYHYKQFYYRLTMQVLSCYIFLDFDLYLLYFAMKQHNSLLHSMILFSQELQSNSYHLLQQVHLIQKV